MIVIANGQIYFPLENQEGPLVWVKNLPYPLKRTDCFILSEKFEDEIRDLNEQESRAYDALEAIRIKREKLIKSLPKL